MAHKVVCQKLNEHEVGGTGGDQLVAYALSMDMPSRNNLVRYLDEEPERIKKEKNYKWLPDGSKYYVPKDEPYFCQVEDDVYLNLVAHAQENGVIFKAFPEKI